MPPEKVEQFGKQVPMKRPGQPAELAAAYVMLASDEASYISGATIAVTGGSRHYLKAMSGIPLCPRGGIGPAAVFAPDAASGRRRHAIERLHGLVRQLQRGGGKVFTQMGHGGCAGYQQDVGRAPQQPGQRHLHGRGAQALCDVGQRGRLQRRETAEREEGHIGDARRGRARRSARRRRDVRGCSGSATQAISQMRRPSATCAGVTLLSADVAHQALALQAGRAAQVNGSSIEPSAGPMRRSTMMRRLTTSSTSTPRLRRLSCTAWVSSAGANAGSHDGVARRGAAPILVTMTRSSG